VTRLRGLERGVNFDTAGVSAPKTLAPKRKRAEIRLHPFGCPERRSSIQQAELESFQRRTPFSQGFDRGDCPSCENRARAQTTNETPQDCRGRFLFGLKMSVAYSTVSTVFLSWLEEKPASFVPFVGSRFRLAKRAGPNKEIQNRGR
jgi:hypothetical protein